jgi:N-acyl amino acid synthase of PEP-CTERM/exosortase system
LYDCEEQPVNFILSKIEPSPSQINITKEITRSDIIDHYHRHFDFRLANSDADKKLAFKLRYQVYCEETGFLSKSDNPFGLECDAHDEHSLHSILMHRSSRQIAGTVRMVMPRTSSRGCAQPARIFSKALDTLPETVLPRATTGEISRFALHQSFRCRPGGKLGANVLAQEVSADAGFDLRHMMPHMKMGLFASIFEIAREHGITHVCAVIDRALLRMLESLGLHFTKAGPAVDFHGMRQPVYASCEDLMAGMDDRQESTGSVWQAVNQVDGLLRHRQHSMA